MTTWEWSCGSSARLVDCRNTAAVMPSLSRNIRDPFERTRVVAARDSIASTAAWTAMSWHSANPSSPDSAHMIDNVLGAEKVASNPITDEIFLLLARSRVVNGEPSVTVVSGWMPSRIAWRCSASTSAARPSAAAWRPAQRPVGSPMALVRYSVRYLTTAPEAP